MSKEDFIKFARKHKELAEKVIKNKITWQKLYELYEIYGEDNNIWNDYIINENNISSFKDLIEKIRSIDLDTVQKGVNNLEKTISLLKNLELDREKENIYEIKPMYEHFED